MRTLLILIVIFSILIGNVIEEDEIYLYDISMLTDEFESNVYTVRCPELFIPINEMGTFKKGDIIYLKLKSSVKDGQRLSWYYPPKHQKNVSIFYKLKKIISKINFKRFNIRIKKDKLFGKSILYPSVRIMSKDILGSARSKVSPELDFSNTRKVFRIKIEDKIDYGDFLRLQGIYFAVENRGEVGTTVIQHGKNIKYGEKNTGEWKELDNYKFKIGDSHISDVNPSRFLRIFDKRFELSLDIESGLYPTIAKNGRLIVRLSENLQANWDSSNLKTVFVNDNRRRIKSYPVSPNVSNRDINIPIDFKIPQKSHLIIPKLALKPTTGRTDKLSSGSISIHTDLTNNVDYLSEKREAQLGESSKPILLMYPSVKIIEEDLIFFLESENIPAVTIIINKNGDGYFEEGDTIKIAIPKEVNLSWGDKKSYSNTRYVDTQKTDNKTIELYIKNRIEAPIKMPKIPLENPIHSISPFNLEYYFSFSPDTTLRVDGEISFGQPSISMEAPKHLNLSQKNLILDDIIITEDEVVTTLRKGDKIEIVHGEEYFSFNKEKFIDINFKTTDKSSINPFNISYGESDNEKIVLRVRKRLDKGESVSIKNIPILVSKKTEGDIFLNYNIKNDKCWIVDENYIRIINLNLDLSKSWDFIRDINNSEQIFSIEKLTFNIEGSGKLFDRGTSFELSFPEKTAEWVDIDDVRVISPSGNFSVMRGRDSSSIILSPSERLFNSITVNILNLSFNPMVNEFIDNNLKMSLIEDPTVFSISKNTITYSYPSLISLEEQIFFTDDEPDNWKIYNFRINSRYLDRTLIPKSIISIIPSNRSISWDRNYTRIDISGEFADKIEQVVQFEGPICNLVVKDTIKSEMSFEISGLKINPIKTPDLEFFLQLSIDQGKTICATDKEFGITKIVKPQTDFTDKINRSIKEATYAMKNGRHWVLKIPDSTNYMWDSSHSEIKPVYVRGLKRGINLNSIENSVEISDDGKIAKISIVNGYGSGISAGLQLSGTSRKKIFFNGLRIRPQSEFYETVPITNDGQIEQKKYLELIVETPYGVHLARSDGYGMADTDWEIKVNNKTSVSYSELINQDLEIRISTPQIKSYKGGGVLRNDQLELYSREHTFLLDPLVKKFKYDVKDQAVNDVLASAKYIKEFYDDTPHIRGNNWKVWFYLAWAKFRAKNLGIHDRLLDSEFLKDNGVFKKTYSDDLKKAIRKGYKPKRDVLYPQPQEDDIYKIRDKIDQAIILFEDYKLIEAEKELLYILDKVKDDKKIKYFSAEIYYWLGRIAINFGDFEYDRFKDSYPYLALDRAKKIHKREMESLVTNPWLEDEISKNKKSAEKLFGSDRNSKKILIKPREKSEMVYSKENIRFIYKSAFFNSMISMEDNSNTFKIRGRSGSKIRLINYERYWQQPITTDGEKIISPMFSDEINVSQGGDYVVKYSSNKEAGINFLTGLILIGLVIYF